MNQHHLVSVTGLNAHIYCSENSLPHCRCFIRAAAIRAAVRTRFSLWVASVNSSVRRWKWYSCFRSSWCRENLSMWKTDSCFWIQDKPWTNLSVFSLIRSARVLWEESFSIPTTLSGWEEGVKVPVYYRQLGGTVLHSLSVGSRCLFWQLQQLDGGRKRPPTHHLFLKPYFLRS